MMESTRLKVNFNGMMRGVNVADHLCFTDENYGKEITIVRNINGNSGASTYKLKNEAGRVVSSSRQDLNKLTMCLNIQVENPVLILNQDAARSFLKECDPKKLYILFLKATQIEAIIDKLHSCLKCASSSKSQLEHLDRSIRALQVEIVGIKEKHEKLQSVAQLKNDIVGYKNELEWIKVTRVEKELLEAQKLLAKKQEQVANINHLIKNKSKIDKELKDKIRDYGTEFAALNTVVNEKDQATECCRDDYDAKVNELSSFENIHKGYVDKKNQQEQNLLQLEADIAERAENPQNVDNMRKENELKIQALEKKKGDVALMIETAKRDHGQFQETLTDCREKLDQVSKQKSREQAEAQKCIGQIRQLQGSNTDALAVYGPSMSQLIKRIEDMHKKGQFKQLPRGPLGRYIEVPDRRYKSAVENILDSSLTSFFVSCDHDRMQLNKVLQAFPEFARLQIITGQFHDQVYDVRNGAVQLEHGTPGRVLMDVMNVSDPVVMNCLIDQKRIETVVLVDSLDVAVELTQDHENVPQNLHRVVLMNPMSEFYPAPNYRSYAMKEKQPRYIQTNHREVIASMEDQKRAHESKVRAINAQVVEVQRKVKEQEKLLQEKKQLMNELHEKDRSYTSQLNDLKAIEYPPEDESEYLKQEAETLKKKLRMFAKKIAESEEKLKTFRDAVAEKEAVMMKSRDEGRAARVKMTKMQLEIEHAQQQLNEMNTEIKSKSNQLQGLRAEEAELQQQQNNFEANIEELVAVIHGERVPTIRADEVVQQLIRSAEKRIKNIESNHENIEDVELLLNNKVQQVEKMEKIREVLDRVIKTLEGIRMSRFHYIKRLRQHMSLRCKHKFNVLMGLRNYSAEVEIDHKEKTLELKVIPRDSQVVDAVSNTKSLSGGERSYSTVSFLISLWSCVDHPFYFLDEYDVFSDEYNRHMMTQLLFNEADKKREKQYGFLTPQDFSNIQASDTITIHKLQDPERMN